MFGGNEPGENGSLLVSGDELACPRQNAIHPRCVPLGLLCKQPLHIDAEMDICRSQNPVAFARSSSKRFCRLQVGFVPNLEFGIYFSTREQHERPHPEPEQEDNDRAERAVGGVI